MFNHRKIKKNRRFSFRNRSGMSYVELIVVISIISILSAVSLVNYRDFQNKVEMKNLANDVGLKIIEAQKTAISGKMPLSKEKKYSDHEDGWRPSYGVYFDLEKSYTDLSGTYEGRKVFYYFVDLDSRWKFEEKTIGLQALETCPVPNKYECIDVYKITKGSYIDKIELYNNKGDKVEGEIDKINIIYTRPDQSAFFYNNEAKNLADDIEGGIGYVKILLKNTYSGMTSSVYVYSSGRVQINQNI